MAVIGPINPPLLDTNNSDDTNYSITNLMIN